MITKYLLKDIKSLRESNDRLKAEIKELEYKLEKALDTKTQYEMIINDTKEKMEEYNKYLDTLRAVVNAIKNEGV